MDLSSVDLNQFARDWLAERGIDPATVPPRKPFDLADHMLAQAEATLAEVLPPIFHRAEPQHPAVLSWIDGYLDDPASAPSLFLLGPVGTGKTHHAFGALRRIALTNARRRRRMTYAVTTQPEFNAKMRPHADGAHLTALADMQTVDLLVFDELGAGKASDWTDDTLHRLVDHRWSHQRPTIVTTNLDGPALRAEVDERVLSRLSGAAQVVLKGADRRLAGGR